MDKRWCLFFSPSWLNMKVVHVVGIIEKLHLSECHRLHDHTVSSAALQNIALFILSNNHWELEMPYISRRCPDLHNNLPVKVTFMLTVDLHNYKTIQTNRARNQRGFCVYLSIDANQTNGAFMKRYGHFFCRRMNALVDVIILFLFGTVSQSGSISK